MQLKLNKPTITMAYTNMDDLESYRLLVELKANENSTDILPNAGENHASIAMSKLFDKTKYYVRMVVGDFASKVCDQSPYLQSLQRCINEDIHIDVITLNNPKSDSGAYQLLLKGERDGKPIRIKLASDKFKQRLSVDGKEKHFSVFDDNKFRFEKDTEKYLAWFSFNAEDQCKYLTDVFKSELA